MIAKAPQSIASHAFRKRRLYDSERTLQFSAGPTAGERKQSGRTNVYQLATQDFDQGISLVNVFLTLKDDLILNPKKFNIAHSFGTKANETLECAGKAFFILGYITLARYC